MKLCEVDYGLIACFVTPAFDVGSGVDGVDEAAL